MLNATSRDETKQNNTKTITNKKKTLPQTA